MVLNKKKFSTIPSRAIWPLNESIQQKMDYSPILEVANGQWFESLGSFGPAFSKQKCAFLDKFGVWLCDFEHLCFLKRRKCTFLKRR